MQVKPVVYKFKADPWELLLFQMWAYCHFNGFKKFTQKHLEVLALLALDQGRHVSTFCTELSDRGIFKSAKSARNYVDELIENKLILRGGRDKKVIVINPSLKHSADENILLNYNIVGIGTPEPPAFIRNTLPKIPGREV